MLRPPAPHELDDFASCVEAAFVFRYPADERERFVAALDPARCLVAEVDAAIVGTLASHLVELTLPGPAIDLVACLTDVGVAPTHRHQGLGHALVARFLADAHRRGEALCLLDAGAPALYRGLGFGPATWSARYRVQPGRTGLVPGVPLPAPLVMLRPHEATSCLPEVFDRQRLRQPGEIVRTPARWRELLEDHKDAEASHFVVAHVPDDVVDGYARYRRRGTTLFLDELVATTPAAYRALYSMLLALDPETTFETGPRPTEEPARFLLSDPGALETIDVRAASWLRLVDVATALSLRGYRGSGAVTIAVSDPDCTWNAGVFGLDCRDGQATVTGPTGGDGALSLGVDALASAYLGATSFAMLVAAGRAEEQVAGAAARADALFAGERVPFRNAEI